MSEEYSHQCRAGPRCAAHTDGGPAITTKPHTICHSCVLKLQSQFADLPDIREALQLFVRRSLVPSAGSKVHSTPEPSVPIDLRVIDLIDDIDTIIARAGGSGAQIGDLIRKPAQQFIAYGKTVHLDGVERALQIGEVWRRADGVIGLSRAWERRVAKCPKCQLRTLGSFAGSDSVQCSNCGGVMARTEYERVTLIMVEKEKGS